MLVVALSGVTCGGKTTLASRLMTELACSVLHQDLYFLDADDPRHEFIPSLGHNNWELLTSMDMPKMLEDTQAMVVRGGKEVLLVEGHSVLNYPPIAQMCHLKFYLTLERCECKRRREGRVYDPADVPGYFDQVLLPV
jgi:nicotinamide/nicotinate riboside kinase